MAYVGGDRWYTHSRWALQSDVIQRVPRSYQGEETIGQKFRRGLTLLGVERIHEQVSHLHTLEGLMATVARRKGLYVLLSDAGDIYDGLVASDSGKAAVLRYQFALRQTTLYFLDDVLDRHKPGMSADQLRRYCYDVGNRPTHEDVLWFEKHFRKPTRRRSSPNMTGRPKAKNDDHVVLMRELFGTMSLTAVAAELLARGVKAPNGRPYSPQNVDYYLHRRRT